MYLRVRDEVTGDEFDALESNKRIGGRLKLVNKQEYPPSPYARAAKTNPLPSTAKGSASIVKKEG